MCNCIETANKLLADRGAALTTPMFGDQFTFVALQKRDDAKRGTKLPLMAASFCPFCGEKYAKAEDL